MEAAMREMQLKDAKATLSAVVDGAKAGEPVVLTRHGRKEAVVISWDEWRRLSDVPSFAKLLTSAPLEANDLTRDDSPMRDVDL
jgi:prevent-host-death family protein